MCLQIHLYHLNQEFHLKNQSQSFKLIIQFDNKHPILLTLIPMKFSSIMLTQNQHLKDGKDILAHFLSLPALPKTN